VSDVTGKFEVMGDKRKEERGQVSVVSTYLSKNNGPDHLFLLTKLIDTSYLLPCQEQQYQTTYSARQISQNFAQYLESALGLSTVKLATNFASIHINYETIRYDETTETKSTSRSQLILILAVHSVSLWAFRLIAYVNSFLS
jgi:hypothetical protein